MVESARPRGTDNAMVIQVIETRSLRGTGMDDKDMCREVKQYWDFDGNLLAENDPCRKEKVPCSLKDELPRQINADRIRAMSDEEPDEFMQKAVFCGSLMAREESSAACRGCGLPFCSVVGREYIEWLQSEVELKS